MAENPPYGSYHSHAVKSPQRNGGPVFEESQRFGDARAVVVAIGGVDPSGGAGLVRDFLTARTLGAVMRLVPSAWTDQASSGVAAVEARGAGALERAVRGAVGRGAGGQANGAAAVKVGMLPDARAVAEVLTGLADFPGPVVVDPVLAASSGGALFQGSPDEWLRLAVRATLLTPNALEATALTGIPVRDGDDAVRAGQALLARGARAVLVKGGHLADAASAIDVLVTRDCEPRRFEAPRLGGRSVRGTGCALATAVAVALARGAALVDAIAFGKSWLHGAWAGAVIVGDELHLS